MAKSNQNRINKMDFPHSPLRKHHTKKKYCRLLRYPLDGTTQTIFLNKYFNIFYEKKKKEKKMFFFCNVCGIYLNCGIDSAGLQRDIAGHDKLRLPLSVVQLLQIRLLNNLDLAISILKFF